MSNTRPARRIFGPNDSALEIDEESPGQDMDHLAGGRRPSGRTSFSRNLRKPSFMGRWRGAVDEENGVMSSPSDRPAIPSALQPPGEVYATPLPVLSMIVLSITMLGEFLSANVSAPFLLFMVEGFGQFSDESDTGYWTGILVSTFFLTQFLTSLLWATIAAKHGQRLVLFVSLLGSAVTCCLFGTSTSIQQAIVIRLMQGVFAGAIGVARGCVTSVTDQTNEGRAYAILGFCWGFGGVAGAIVGGTFESPAVKWPSVFSKAPIFIQYPYLLPCAVASSVTLAGSVLCLFLGPDCGPREGAIRLPMEKIVSLPEEPTTPLLEEPEDRRLHGSLRRKLSGRLSTYFTKRGRNTDEGSITPSQSQEQPVPLTATPTRGTKSRTSSQASRANGSAYGYSGAYRHRLASGASMTSRRGSMGVPIRRRTGSAIDVPQSSMATGSELNFAQRLLMANENAVTNIADLWVAAAITADNEDPFESESELDREGEEIEEANRLFRRDSAALSSHTLSNKPSNTSFRPSSLSSPHRPSFSRRVSNLRHTSSALLAGHAADEFTPRRLSTTAPSIFSHVGVRTPPAVLEAQQLLLQSEGMDSLAPIVEFQQASQDVVLEKEPSLFSQLPVMIIIQYGLLALHSTTHDQVFYLYLVSKYQSGGLNLNAGHFSQLIALMCLAQIAYQFYFYPNIGPPRGRFSHLSMFRIGSLLFIPSYLSVILYRIFANPSEDGNLILMAALALSTAVRFCGSTFGYTAISVLLNYMSPPHIVGYANGIAQSIVSLARFFGPILGGTLWSMSVQDNPSGYPLGFIACACACALAVAHSFFIR
ncbi:Protein ZINC INDUCED FACILITATOR 1 [Grifola frondosa]|uniref:Protein ZINC INDUCED FACILITATOR 1 n=1 Tax=Grifola frondosa TaxID=5627 RepID=A0A1C7LS12_GRIFR|nr:Protein ZINC INDUCED FACILITATOR 1 [Grifola frondosa]